MVSYVLVKQMAVEIGEHIDGIGTVLDQDDESMVRLMEGRETFTLSEIEQLFDDLGKSDGGTTTAVVDGIEYSTGFRSRRRTMVNDKQDIADMVLNVGWVEGKLDVLAAFSDGKVRQELLNAKSCLANLADDLIRMLEDDE